MDKPDIRNTSKVRGVMFPRPAEPAEEPPDDNPALPASAVPAHTQHDQIRNAEPRPEPKRNRAWEQAHRGVTFRKVPTEVRAAVLQVAGETGYTASQIAQAFLEYALESYNRHEFALETELGPRGVTLYPGGQWGAESRPIWAVNPDGQVQSARRRKKEKSIYKQQVSYRLPPGLVAALMAICRVPSEDHPGAQLKRHQPGEVVTRFLSFSLDAYAAGRMILTES